MFDLPRSPDPDDALAQPTRRRLFRVLGELSRPASTGELAERVGLHPNGVRAHLNRMQRAGLVVSTRQSRPRGRPREQWAIAPTAQPGGEPPRGYHDLATWLSRAITAGRPSLRSIEATGREIGRELAPEGSGARAVLTSLTALGFQPRLTVLAGRRVTVCLDNCPYADAVVANQPAVCGLHRGITRGLLDLAEPGARLVSFEPNDPHRAGCLIEIAGIGTAEPAAA